MPAGQARAQALYEQDPINYLATPATDPVAALKKQLDSGSARLEYNARNGYLESLLRHLNIPLSSQTLVFSKTSFQRDRISPANPRGLYFDDNTYVGWVRGGDVLELASTDPNLGTVFYTLDQRPASDGKPPRLVRQTHSCLQCHGSTMTRDIPGLLVRSVFPDRSGQPMLSAGTYFTTLQSPFAERWGGWYVTGSIGNERHMGNAFVLDEQKPEASLDRELGGNLTDLPNCFDTAAYPTPHSDVVALMVLTHQAELHNLLTRANYHTRVALRDEAAMNAALGRPEGQRSDSTTSRIKSAGEALVRALLFADEQPLGDPIKGTSTFTQDFPQRGPRDRLGRSLRDFDLERRLFRYPCSYLIYSESFDSLPREMKDYVYGRLWQILNGHDDSGDFSHVKRSTRRAIIQILAETKQGLPAYWKAEG